MGIPMISVFPLDNPDAIPLDGLPHYLGKIPYIGSKFKKTLIDTLNKRIKFFALPNIKAEKEIVPEIRGMVEPAEVALKAVALLKDTSKRQEMSKELIRSMGESGAALKIMEEIDETLHPAA
jgi:lipid-A-disaccharide synthase